MTAECRKEKYCRHVKDPLRVILDEYHGHARSQAVGRPIGPSGEPLPWYTYPAIEYLMQLDLTSKKVFEYGCGYSSLFWCKYAASVISVERSEEWYREIKGLAPGNLQLEWIAKDPGYADSILGHEGMFDIIVIDGSRRLECARRAIGKLARGGMIILDNSDWYTKTGLFLRKSGFRQIDLIGFGPINNYTWATSLYMGEDFFFESQSHAQPSRVIGGLMTEPEEEKGIEI